MSIKYANSDIISVPTVNDLFSLKGIRDNQLVQTQGYSTEGVGANLYRYDASGAATVNGGFVLPGLNGTLSFSGTTFNGTSGTGQFVAVDQSVADVTKFGGIGDGVTDDANSIQRAVSSITFAGGEVFFPIGKYVVSSTITVEDRGPITFRGLSTNLIKGTSADHSSQIAPSAGFGTTTAVFDIVSNAANDDHDHGGVTFKDIMIRPLSGVRGYGINVRKGAGDTSFWGDIRLDNCCIRYCTIGLRLTNSGGSGFGWISVVNSSRIEECGYGVYADCTLNQCVFSNSIIRLNTPTLYPSNSSYTSRSSGGIIIPYGDQILISGCDLEGQQVAIQTSGSNWTIQSNYFEASFDASIVLSGCTNITITGNYFADDYKTKQIYVSNCNQVIAENNEGAVPVYVGVNRDCYFSDSRDAILSCVGGAHSSTISTLTVSNVTALLWSEDMVYKLTPVGMESTYYPTTAIGGTITNKTQGSGGPNGRSSLILVAESETSKTYVNPVYNDLESAQALNGITFTADASSNVITTSSSHGFLDGDQVCVYTSGTLPAGLSTAIWYYVINKTSTTFKLAATHGGTEIDITDAGTGTFYVTKTGEYIAQNFWIKTPSTNTSTAPYMEHRHSINASGTGDISYIGTPITSVFSEDRWMLMQIIEKIPVGIVVASGGYDCNLRIYQTTVSDKSYFSGIAATKTRSINVYPRHMMYVTDVNNEAYRSIDDRHYMGAAAPTSTLFAWNVGTQIEYLAPSGGGSLGLVCTASGAPGTWKTFGAITA